MSTESAFLVDSTDSVDSSVKESLSSFKVPQYPEQYLICQYWHHRLPDLLLKDTLVKTDSHSSSNSSGVGLLYFTFPSIIIPSCLGVHSISIQKIIFRLYSFHYDLLIQKKGVAGHATPHMTRTPSTF